MTADADREVVFDCRRGICYQDGVRLQRDILATTASEPSRPGTVIMAEHQPVITCGRSGDGSNLLVRPEELMKRGVEYHLSGRGGDVTYHGPGQWTVYPILRLAWFNRDLHRYLRLLEECVIHFLSNYGISGTRRPGFTGVWVDGGKIAAVGVAVSRWITWHGFALNIHPDIDNFTRYMHPCGIRADKGAVSSLESVTGRDHSMEAVQPVLRRSILEVLNLSESREIRHAGEGSFA